MDTVLYDFKFLLSKGERRALFWRFVSPLALFLILLITISFVIYVTLIRQFGEYFLLPFLLPLVVATMLFLSIRNKNMFEEILIGAVYSRFQERLLFQEGLIPASYFPRMNEIERYYDLDNNVIHAVVKSSPSGEIFCFRGKMEE